MKKKGRTIAVIIAITALALAAFAAYRYVDDKLVIEPRRFAKEKESIANKVYERVMIDLDINYPSSPEGVMDFFNDAFYLMYSNMIINDGTLLEVMMQQRETYSDEMKALNSEEVQFVNLQNMLEELSDGNHICLSVERKGTVYDEKTPGECTVQVMIYYNTAGSIYRNYYLKHENGRWKVNAWLTTDENYTDTR